MALIAACETVVRGAALHESSSTLSPSLRQLRVIALGLAAISKRLQSSVRVESSLDRQAVIHAIYVITRPHALGRQLLLSLSPSIVASVAENVWGWIAYATRAIFHKTVPYEIRAIRLVSMALIFLQEACEDRPLPCPEGRAVMARLLRIWFRERSPEADISASGAILCLRTLISSAPMGAGFDLGLSTIMEEVVEEIGSCPRAVIEAILRRLRKADLQHSVAKLELLLPFLMTERRVDDGLNDLGPQTPSVFHRMVYEHSGIVVVIRKLLDALNIPLGSLPTLPNPNIPVQPRVVASGLMLISRILTMLPGLAPLRQAVNAGLMSVIVVGSFTHVYAQLPEVAQDVLKSLISFITPSLMIQRIRKDIETALRRDFQPHHECCDGPHLELLGMCDELLTEWDTFGSLLRRVVFAQSLFYREKLLEMVTCANVSLLRR